MNEAFDAGLKFNESAVIRDTHYTAFDAALDGIAVADGGPHDPHLRRHVPKTGDVSLVNGPHFRLDRLDGAANEATRARYGGRPLLVIPVDAPVTLAGEIIAPGQCALADDFAAVEFGEGRALIAQPV